MADLREQIDMTHRTCDVSGCGRKHYAHGYCNTHMRRWKKTGDPGPAAIVRQKRADCSFSNCGRPAVSHGLCNSHRNQRRRGQQLAPLRSRNKSTTRDEHGRKPCSTCKNWLAPTEFYPNPKLSDGLTTYCKRCDRSARLLRNYGITADQYDAMLDEQGGTCAICPAVPKDGQSLHVDHDHACCPGRKKSCGQCVRGLLCEDCNRVLGMFRDDTTRLQSAIDYLSRERL